MKTHNLTWSRIQNNLINRQIQGFSFRDSENKVWHSRCDSFQFFQPILDFKHSRDTELSLEEV